MLQILALVFVVVGPIVDGFGNFGPPPSNPANTCKVPKMWKAQIRGLRKHEEFKVGHGFRLKPSKLPQKYKLSPDVYKVKGQVKCTANGWNVDPHHFLIVPAHSHGMWCYVAKVWKFKNIKKLHAGLSLKVRCPASMEYNDDIKKANGKLKCEKGNWNVCDKSPLCVKAGTANKANNQNFNFY
ncbi:uncharacterized protein LOC135500500 [Lineus longissimus]|uniref:uncharacterized protein LOC135500500 n=1 Tax=Lineus longissimus TaxID=88925 RepID=UPI002B4ED696